MDLVNFWRGWAWAGLDWLDFGEDWIRIGKWNLLASVCVSSDY